MFDHFLHLDELLKVGLQERAFRLEGARAHLLIYLLLFRLRSCMQSSLSKS